MELREVSGGQEWDKYTVLYPTNLADESNFKSAEAALMKLLK
jgi:hypothetical protein